MLATEDEKCSEVMAEILQSPRVGFMQHIYWEDLSMAVMPMDMDPLDKDDRMGTTCTVM